ncbi:unnamed protein product [Cladocopium goreaui]|uniref:Glycosyl transferase family 1 domain-containing protein n=1 Tax=Cladocopium goreaui TaxID=2562237 RepID=A0A9P1DCT2_9DINO|nr:unnamed protein product [Cladocopium goreaui]
MCGAFTCDAGPLTIQRWKVRGSRGPTASALPTVLPLGLEGELRAKLCVALATKEDQRIAEERQKSPEKAVPKAQEKLPPQQGEWRPRWHVLRDHDAFPGQDLGKVPISQLAEAKAFCERKALAGLVVFGGVAYLRAQHSADALRQAANFQEGADLLLRPSLESPARPQAPKETTRLRVAVLATQDEFDETSLFDPGMVSSTGNGRRYAAQALVRSVQQSRELELTAVLVYDWKNEKGHWAVPSEGPQQLTLTIRGGEPVTAWRGSMGQLLGACAGDLDTDLAVSIQARRTSLELMLRSIKAKKYVVMGHDYNLPFGPWGMEVEPQMLALHQTFIQNPKICMFCTSQHLADFVQKFSQGKVKTKLCYCADYGYFDGKVQPVQPDEQKYVTFISPCPAKGLAIVLRLALMFPKVEFLCVSTGWTKTLHEVQLRAHGNVKIVPGTDDLDAVYRQTAVLIMPSLWQESFGLVAVEAQLRGICVVSSGSYGLREANFIEELQADVTLVHDSRTREMLRGITLTEAEERLDPLRKRREGHDHIHMAHTLIATEKEVEGFAQLLHRLVVPWLFRWPPPFISCVCCWLDMRELKQMNPTSFHRQRLSSAVEIDVETTSIISICQPMFGVIIMILTILTMTGWWFRTCFSIYWE